MRQGKPLRIFDHSVVDGLCELAETLELDSVEQRSNGATEAARISIALIDPKPLTRQAVIEMLSRAFPGDVTVAVSSCDELARLETPPQLVILYVRSVSVTDAWVQDELRLIQEHLREVPLAMISDSDDPEEVRKALRGGVRGYIPSSIASGVALAALNLVYAGGTFIPECALGPASSNSASATLAPAVAERGGPFNELDLTPRELSVVDLLREGKPNKRIAFELNMQESTVKVHVRSILKKLNAANRTQAASVANRLLARQAAGSAAAERMEITPAAD